MMPVLTNAIRRVRRGGPNPVRRREAASWLTLPRRSTTGQTITDETAVGIVAFYRGVSLISQRIASLPLHIYQERPDDRPVRVATPETYYLRGRPNTEQRRPEFWQQVVADLIRGNAFLWVEKGPTSEPVGLWRIDRRRVRVGRLDDGTKVYELDGELPMVDYRAGGEIVHIPNWGDGLVGYDVVAIASEAIALGLSAQEYAARMFSQGDVPPGIITTDQQLTPEQARAIADAWHEQRAGLANAGRTAVLGNGARFQMTAVDPESLQMESLRGFQAREIATLLGIPPHMLGLVDRSTSWGSGIAEQNLQFVQYTLDYYIKLLETAIDDDLLVRELTGRYCKLDLGAMLRGTLMNRYMAYAMGYGRWLTANDIRRDEDLPPVEGGDELLAAMNLAPLEEIINASALEDRGSG